MKLILLGIGLLFLTTSCQDLETMGTYEEIWFNRGVYCTMSIYEWDLDRGTSTQSDDIVERAQKCFKSSMRATIKRRNER